MGLLKKCSVALLLFWCAAFSLHAQYKSNIYIYFASITGTGQTPNDNRLLVNMITSELAARKYTMINTPQTADFLLYGTLALFDENEDYVSNIRPAVTYTYNAGLQDYSYDQLYIFQLVLRKADTGEIILHNILYATLDDTYNFFPIIVNNLLMHIGGMRSADDWPDHWLNVGVGAFWSPRVYKGEHNESVHYANFGGSASAEAHFWKYLSFEMGINLVPDWVRYSETEEYNNLMLEIPLALKFYKKLTYYFLIAPYGGVHFNVPLYATTKPPPVAWMLGVTGGIRVGPGMVFIDPRFSMDIGQSILNRAPRTEISYQRTLIHIGLGYKYGFFPKKEKSKPAATTQ